MQESIISSIDWSLITWSDSAIYNNISTPIFTRMGSIINAIIAFRPVFVVVAMFWLFIWFLIWLGWKSKDKNKKSLDNK